MVKIVFLVGATVASIVAVAAPVPQARALDIRDSKLDIRDHPLVRRGDEGEDLTGPDQAPGARETAQSTPPAILEAFQSGRALHISDKTAQVAALRRNARKPDPETTAQKKIRLDADTSRNQGVMNSAVAFFRSNSINAAAPQHNQAEGLHRSQSMIPARQAGPSTPQHNQAEGFHRSQSMTPARQAGPFQVQVAAPHNHPGALYRSQSMNPAFLHHAGPSQLAASRYTPQNRLSFNSQVHHPLTTHYTAPPPQSQPGDKPEDASHQKSHMLDLNLAPTSGSQRASGFSVWSRPGPSTSGQ